MTTKPKVLIAGAGIGGLAAAACLLKRGFRVRVFEQAPALGEVGAGIQVSANAVKVLYDLGLREALEAVAVKPKAFEFRRFDTGEQLHRVPLNEGDNHVRRYGTPYYHIHRVDIHSLLADKVRELDPGCLQLGQRATGFTESGSDVTLHLANGASATGDVLIGADGIKSVVRPLILGATAARFTGQVAWRAVIPVERLPQGIMDRVVTVWCGPKNHAVVYFLRGGRLMNFVGCVEREWEEESWTAKKPWSELKADYAGWHPDIQSIVDAIDHDACYRWAMNNREPVDRWSTDRVTLLGDAAHPTLPYMAQGAVMSIEDGAVLARALEGSASVPAALDLYQRNRTERTARVVRESTEHGDIYHIADAAEMRRAFEEKNIAKSRDQWLYPYDPLTVELT
jgi:salicylate hydroxylase